MNFSDALKIIKDGGRVIRKSWPMGTGLAMQVPNIHSFMKQPYIYIETMQVSFTDVINEKPLLRVPWTPSYDDLFAEDWEEHYI